LQSTLAYELEYDDVYAVETTALAAATHRLFPSDTANAPIINEAKNRANADIERIAPRTLFLSDPCTNPIISTIQPRTPIAIAAYAFP
jgi:hypothetical protein